MLMTNFFIMLIGIMLAAYNDFDHPNDVKIKPFDTKNVKVKKGVLSLTLPAKSIVTIGIMLILLQKLISYYKNRTFDYK